MFTPSCNQDNLSLLDESGDKRCATIIVENCGDTSMYLEAGIKLGTVSAVEELKSTDPGPKNRIPKFCGG